MELEDNNSIPFLDVLISRKEEGNLGHEVYMIKKTHTEKYLHASSHHHPAQKIGVFNTFATRSIQIFVEENLEQEKYHLYKVFRSIGYKDKYIRRAIRKAS
jgi:hypothetical protein